MLLSAYATEEIGIALIFGAFVMGLVMPRHAGLTEDVTGRIEDFTITLLLPLFFAFTGLQDRHGPARPAGAVAHDAACCSSSRWSASSFGAAIAARITGFSWRDSAVIGTLMNTRGLTELIVLNLALEKGVISDALFAMLVIMALVTTLMAGPLLRLLDPKNELGAPVEEELEEAREALAGRVPGDRRAGAVDPGRAPGRGGARAAARAGGAARPLRAAARADRRAAGAPATRRLGARRRCRPRTGCCGRRRRRSTRSARELIEAGIAARGGRVRLDRPGRGPRRASPKSDEIALVLMDGRRPLLGEGVPRGDVGEVLREAPCDVGVLVAKEDADGRCPAPDDGVVVPFGGAEHDWAALEIGAWIASATGAPLKLLGAAGQTEERAQVTRLLGDAGLLVQQYAGVQAQPVMAEEGREGMIEAAAERRPARDRAVRPLARGGPRPDALGDREGGAGAGPVRAPRHAPRRARAARGRDALLAGRRPAWAASSPASRSRPGAAKRG